LRAGPPQRRRDGHGHPGAHRANYRGEKDLPLAEADVAMDKTTEISSVGRDGGVGRQVLVDLADDRGEIHAVASGLPFLGQKLAVDSMQPVDPAAALAGICRSATPE
jgi:hypothetical protein